MDKLPRVTAKIFASNALETDIGQYGSALTGTKVLTSNIEEIQALPAYEQGWRGAVISNRNYPTLQEMNGLQKTFSQQIAYIFQEGIPEWDINTNYFITSIVKNLENNNIVLYHSLIDNNQGNPLTDMTKWQKVELGGSGTALPLLTPLWFDHKVENMSYIFVDNFSWNSGITYAVAYNELLQQYNDEASTAVTEDNITYKLTPKGYKIADPTQEEAINTLYNSTAKAWFYILDTENVQFKLPRSKGPIVSASGSSTATTTTTGSTIPVIGNGKAIGLVGKTSAGADENAGLTHGVDSNGRRHLSGNPGSFNTNVGTVPTATNNWVNNTSVGLSTTNSGIVADISKANIQTTVNTQIETVQSDVTYLYFYAGNFTQDALENTAGITAEVLAGKADSDLGNLSEAGEKHFLKPADITYDPSTQTLIIGNS